MKFTGFIATDLLLALAFLGLILVGYEIWDIYSNVLRIGEWN